MSGDWRVALSVGPLAYYFAVLAVWQGGRHPRVVSGRIDFALLAFAVGGLAAFGPCGEVAARMLFGKPNGIDWLAIASAVALAALYLGRRAGQKLVVYHVDAEALDQALHKVCDEEPGRFVATLRGFEDRAGGRGVSVEVSPRLRAAVVHAFGPGPEALIRDLIPRLRHQLERVDAPRSRLGPIFLGLASLTAAIPMVGAVFVRFRAREMFRVLLEHLRGG
jgi:hypothetical protein